MIYSILAVYFAAMILITILFTKRNKTKEDFTVGNRNTGTFRGGLSIAATWIWAPSLLVSAELGYKWGWYGLALFLIPNILCLFFFIPYAKKIREQYPEGTNLPDYMEKKHGKRVGDIYRLFLRIIAVASTAVQLLAGGLVLTTMSNISFLQSTILLSLIAFAYVLYSGIRANYVTNTIQMLIMLVFSVITVLFTGHKFGLSQFNFGGATEFNKMGVLLSFGVSTFIGLMSGPFGDQSFWQLAFSINKKKIKNSFILGAILFAVIPISMGLIGMASSSLNIISLGTVNLQFIMDMLPSIFSIIFIFIVLSGIMSSLDSNLLTFAALSGDLKKSKWSMLLLLVLGIGIANIPNLTVTKLFMIYGSIRSITLLPTLLTLHKKNIKYIDVGMTTALAVATPIFAYGTIKSITPMIIIGSLMSLFIPAIIIYLGGKYENIRIKRKSR